MAARFELRDAWMVSVPRPNQSRLAAVPARIWLVGLMGSGKTTVGRLISQAIGVPYIDNDTAVASLAGRSILALAAAGGELLHDWESRFVHGLVDAEPPLVAGIPASVADRPADLELLGRHGLLVYLRADLGTLTSRVEADPPRPWLSWDPRPVLEHMLTTRDPVLLAAAGLVVDAARRAEEVAGSVVDAARAGPSG